MRFTVLAEAGEFVVQTSVGDYILVYETNFGGYAGIVRAHETALVSIGLHDDQEVINALLIPGTITAIPSDAWKSG